MRDWLKAFRLEQGYTLKKLSQLTGVSYQALNYYETGRRTPTVKVAKRIGNILGFDWKLFYP